MQVDETSFGVTEKGSGQAGEEVPFLQAFGGSWVPAKAMPAVRVARSPPPPSKARPGPAKFPRRD
eukprot:177833-Amphidinium_carterae.1